MSTKCKISKALQTPTESRKWTVKDNSALFLIVPAQTLSVENNVVSAYTLRLIMSSAVWYSRSRIRQLARMWSIFRIKFIINFYVKN